MALPSVNDRGASRALGVVPCNDCDRLLDIIGQAYTAGASSTYQLCVLGLIGHAATLTPCPLHPRSN